MHNTVSNILHINLKKNLLHLYFKPKNILLSNGNIFLKNIILLILILVFPKQSFTQNENFITHQPQFWSETNFYEKLSDNWATQVDIQYARQGSSTNLNLFKYQQQFTIRLWGHYNFSTINNHHLRLSAFIGNWDNDAIADLNIKRENEYRAAIQFTTYSKKQNPLYINRFRLEYKLFEQNPGNISDGLDNAIRFRYQTRYYKPLNKSTLDTGALYLMAFQETFLYILDERGRISNFDQNRIFIGLGYKFSSKFTLEAGYFGMLQMFRNENQFYLNHIFQVSIYFDNLLREKFHLKKQKT